MLAVSRMSLLYRPSCTNLIRKNYLHAKNPLKPIRKYVFSSYFDFLTNYGNKLENNFPKAIRLYRIFKDGFWEFYQDIKLFIAIRRKLHANKRDFTSLTRKELELSMRMSRDIFQVSPVLLISALPLTNYVVFPVAYFFPRYLLSRHFWTLQQKIEFATLDQKRRLKYYKPVFRCLQAKVTPLRGHPLYLDMRHCIAQLGSGLHPRPDRIAAVEPLFAGVEAFALSQLTSSHLKALLKMHDMHSGWRRRYRLAQKGQFIHHMDLAIIREGGLAGMTQEDIRTACFIRGLNPTNMNSEETVRWLTQWIQLSEKITDGNWSFVLHLPLLMAYNHPSNWVLIH